MSPDLLRRTSDAPGIGEGIELKGYKVLGFDNPRTYADKGGNKYRTIEKKLFTSGKNPENESKQDNCCRGFFLIFSPKTSSRLSLCW